MNNEPYTIFLDPSATHDLNRLSSIDYKRIDKHILSLRYAPRPRGCVKLGDDIFRIRVGPWRIIYLVDDSSRRVIISRIRRREKDTYRRT